MQSNKKIAVIQKIIPYYREVFFAGVCEKAPDAVILHSSKIMSDGLVKNVEFKFPNISVKIFDKFVYYQTLVLDVLKPDYECVVLGLELKIVSNYFIWFLCRLKRKKIIWWTHGYNVHIKKKCFKFFIDRAVKTYLMKRCHKILIYTDYNLDELVSRGIPRDKIIILNNTINEKPHQSALKQVTEADLEVIEKNTKKSQHTLLFIGRLTRNKHVDLLLGLSARLVDAFPDLRVFVIGDGSERLKLVEQNKRMGLEKHVFFLGTITDPKKLAPYFKKADFSVLPGAVGLSIVQSFIYGVPFLTVKNAEHGPEIAYLKDDYNGYAAEDMDDMFAWLTKSFANPRKMETLKRNCLESIKDNINLDSMVSQFVKSFS